MTNDKRMQDIVNNMINKANTPDPNILAPDGGLASDQPSQIEVLAMVVQNLEMGMMQLAQSQQLIGTSVDVSRLTNQLLVRMMVEKGVFSEEEFRERYKTDVTDRIQQMQKQLQEEYKKQMQEQAANGQVPEQPEASCEPNCKEECTECTEPEKESDVVLPSERSNKVIRFPNK
jgi:polyhydroxyalkanoate synthesis regulator phasin